MLRPYAGSSQVDAFKRQNHHKAVAFNPRDLRRLLKRLGIGDLNFEEVKGVERVLIQFGDGSQIEISNPMVVRVKMHGVVVYQIQASESSVKSTRPVQQGILIQSQGQYEPSEEDIKLVMEETGCSREEAIMALKETKGDIAEAILKIQSKRGGG